MKHISLLAVTLTHFRSFDQPTRIEFSTGASLKLITGNNEAEPRLGANGCGKSTLWDAVCFALYGTSVKGLRAADLVTSGQQVLSVSLELKIDDSTYVIHRTAPPMRIHLDDEPYEQDGIDRLVGLSRGRFLNSVIFGQAVPLFIDLPVPARGDLLDEVLGLELWLEAANLAGEKHREANNMLTEVRRSIARTTGRIEGLGDPARFDVQQRDWEAAKEARLADIVAALTNAENEQTEITAQLGGDTLATVSERDAQERYVHFRELHTNARARLAQIDTSLITHLKTIELLEVNDTCPTCGQVITKDHVEHHLDTAVPQMEGLDKQREVALLDIQTTDAEVKGWEIAWHAAIQQNQNNRTARTLLTRRAEEIAREIERLSVSVMHINSETNPVAAEAQRVRMELAQLNASLIRQTAEETTTIALTAALDYWRQGFRKVRLFCIERVLRELTVETRNSLLALGLVGWQVAFTTASETRSGTLKLGVQVDIRAPEAERRFEMMSGGESQRARLAVSLGLANLIQRWAGVRFDLEVYDEPTAWLSDRGVEDLLESLRGRAEANDRSIWVCDHRALVYAGFDEVMNIVKTAGGSRIAP